MYIHYTASIVLANSFFWPEYTFITTLTLARQTVYAMARNLACQ